MSEILYNLPMADYQRRRGLSSTRVKNLFSMTPYHCWHKWDTPEPPLDSPHSVTTGALTIGTALHTLLLEPDKVEAGSVRLPELNYRKKEDKAEWVSIRDDEAHKGKVFLRPELWTLVEAMAEGARKNPATRELLGLSGACEASLFGDIKCEDSGIIPAKVRVDKAIKDARMLVDVKTCEDASPEGFAKALYNFGYFVQAGFYEEVWNRADLFHVEHFVFIAVEKKAPYASAVYTLDRSDVEAGRHIALCMAQLYKNCVDSGDWPGYSPKIETLGMPAWSRKQLANR